MRVVLDTNVLVSAFLWQGAPKDIFALAERGEITVCVSRETVNEFERILSYPKFAERLARLGKTPAGIIDEFLDALALSLLPVILPAFLRGIFVSADFSKNDFSLQNLTLPSPWKKGEGTFCITDCPQSILRWAGTHSILHPPRSGAERTNPVGRFVPKDKGRYKPNVPKS